jgi:hypothetical protein
LSSFAKKQGSRDNISVIVVYLKEPEIIATQSWPSDITLTQSRDNMDNLNMYEPEQVAPQQQQQPIVSMDALGNTNQVRRSFIFLSPAHHLSQHCLRMQFMKMNIFFCNSRSITLKKC